MDKKLQQHAHYKQERLAKLEAEEELKTEEEEEQRHKEEVGWGTADCLLSGFFV